MKRQRHNIDIYLDSFDSKNIEILSKSKRQFGEGTLSTYNTDLPTSSKYGILSLVSNLRFPNMGNIIKRSLEDDNDEIRLYAFNILSKEENFINNELKKRLEKLELNNEDNIDKSLVLKEIGILYWELLFLDLVDSELNGYYLSLSEEYFKKALLSNQNDYEIFLYLGRIYLKKKEYDTALDYFQKVVELNEKEKALPYMAEIYFNLTKHEKAKSILSTLSKTEIHPNFYSNYCAWIRNE
ncbi:tetratricopeptide repeat protein [Deferribacteraceae bacterium V6Fe1]|nr:tetratricopeptide repeat protein [Deferribacteraceae bacterium V6Fe1]